MKKTLAILLALVLLTGFTACSITPPTQNDVPDPTQDVASTAQATPQMYKIAYTTMEAKNPYFVTVINGMKDRAAELGIELAIHDPNMDAAKQVQAVEDFITGGYNAIIISPIDSNALVDVVARAKDAGIKVITQAQMVENADVKLTLDEYQYGFEGGKLAGEWINSVLGGKAEVAILAGVNIEALAERNRGLKEGILQTAPGATIVSEQPGNSRELGMTAAENILQANPNVKVIAAINDAGALGAMESVKAMGKASEDFYIGGLDAATEALDKMKEEGSIYRGTVDLDPYGAGQYVVDLAIASIKGEPLEEIIYMKMKPVTQEELRK
jgi:ribose transport system substrate-binding protein